MVTRLCLDQLKSARRQRETYIGPWLPEPVVEDEDNDVTLPLMLALERLTPLERAAFLLHDVFGLEFEEVAATIQRDAAACRQLAARARAHVREARPRFQVSRNSRAWRWPKPFSPPPAAATVKALGAMLAADVSSHADGGGKRPAATHPVLGVEARMKQYSYILAVLLKHPSALVRVGFVNGLPGFITLEADGELQTTALEIQDGKIAAIYVVRNPDKLRHLH